MSATRINSQDIKDLNVATVDIQDDAVTTVKILNANVTNAKLDATGVSAATYDAASLVINAQGRVTSAANILTTKGDLLSFGTSAARLGVGANGSFLVADSTQTLGLKYLLPSATLPLSYNPSTGISSLAGLSSIGSANQILGVNSGATAWEYKTLSGTANRVIVTFGAGSITLSSPQDIATSSSPTFANVILSGKTTGSVIFVGTSGSLTEDNSNLFFDDTNNRLGVGTNVPSRTFDINGDSLFQGPLRIANSSAPNSNFEVFQADITTADNSYATIASITVPTNSAMMIKVFAVGRRTGGSAGSVQDSAVYERTARFKNVAGTVTIFNLQSDFTSEDQGNFDTTMDVNGTNARIRVRGQTNNDLSWTATYWVTTI